METYLAVKLLHILSATVLLGTGAGIAFFMLRAWQSGNEEVMRLTTQHVVQADWLFTTPAVVTQFVTGPWLTSRLGIAFGSAWFVIVVALFAFIGACWIPVVWIQIRVRNRIAGGATLASCNVLMRWWIALGVPAFASVLVLFAIMVYKPWTSTILIAH